MKISLWVLAFALPLGPASAGQDTQEVETVRHPRFVQIIQEIARTVDQEEGPSLVIWLVDNASVLKNSKHDQLLAEYIPRFFGKSTREIHHAVFSFEETPRRRLRETRDLMAVARAIQTIGAEEPDDRIKNTLLNIRLAAKYGAGFDGKRFLVLFTQENGDNEDDLDVTLPFLKKTGVRFFAISGEAVYSDPYWKSVLSRTSYYSGDVERYRKLKFQLKGPESAYIEFPYGWPLMMIDPSYTVPSGFGTYGLTCLAKHTGGKYFLYHVARSTSTFCRSYSCGVCQGGHKNCGAIYDPTKLMLTAPDFTSREQMRRRYSREKLFLAIVNLWERLFRKGLLQGSPHLSAARGSLAEAKGKQDSPTAFLTFSRDWRSNGGQAVRAAAELDKLILEFSRAIERYAEESDMRVRATAEALEIHLRFLAFNLRQLAHFCIEMERITRLRKPVIPGFGISMLDGFIGANIIGYGYRSLFLCHGGASLRDCRLLGDSRTVTELQDLLDRADRVIERHRGTPWELLARRAALVVFSPVVRVGQGKPSDRDRPKSGSNDTETGTGGSPNRPSRPTTGGGGAGGTVTGD